MSETRVFGRLTIAVLLLSLLLLSLVLLADAAAPQATVRYATRAGQESGDCTTPATACALQRAIDVSNDGDEIRLAGYPNPSSSPTKRYITFITRPAPTGYDGPTQITQIAYISRTVTLRGGYASDFSTWNPSLYETVLDGSGGVAPSVRGIFVAPGASPTLEYLHVISSTADTMGGVYVGGGGYTGGGGGIYALGTNGGNNTIIIRNCVVEGNLADNGEGYGGGIWLGYRPGAILSGNIIRNNIASASADGQGGGAYIGNSSNVVMSNNVFEKNRATTAASAMWTGGGGGLRLFSSDNATISNNQMYDNVAQASGGALWLSFSNNARITGNEIYRNIANSRDANGTGGGIRLFYADGAVIQSNRIYSNTAAQSTSGIGLGGGVYVDTSNSVTITANVITGNIANTTGSGSGGGLGIYASNYITSRDNLIAENVATPNAGAQFNQGGGIRISYGSQNVILINDVIARNTAPGGGHGIYLFGTSGQPVAATLLHNTIADNGIALSGSQAPGSPRSQIPSSPPVPSALGELRLMSTLPSRSSVPQSPAQAGEGLRADAYVTVNGTNNIVSGHSLGINVVSPANSTVTLNYTLWYNNTTNYSAGVTSTNEHSGNPVFVNPSRRNYHICSASAAKDVGANVGITTDIDGEARPQGSAYDIGADEYYPSTPSPGLRVAQAITSTNTLTATLQWTALDRIVTSALRYSTAPINADNWSAATVLSDTIPADTTQYLAIIPYSGGRVYFGMKYQDTCGGESPITNASWPSINVYLPLVAR